MQTYLEKLRATHRRLDRAIDTMRAPSRQEDRKRLKKLRLMVKDRIAALSARKPATGS